MGTSLVRSRLLSLCFAAIIVGGAFLSTVALAEPGSKEEKRGAISERKNEDRESSVKRDSDSRRESENSRSSESRNEKSDRLSAPSLSSSSREAVKGSEDRSSHRPSPLPFENAFGKNGTLRPRDADEPANYAKERVTNGQNSSAGRNSDANRIWWSTGDRLLREAAENQSRPHEPGAGTRGLGEPRGDGRRDPGGSTNPGAGNHEPGGSEDPGNGIRGRGTLEPGSGNDSRPRGSEGSEVSPTRGGDSTNRYRRGDLEPRDGSSYGGSERGIYWSVGDSNIRRMAGSRTIWDRINENRYTESTRSSHRCFDRYDSGHYYYRHPNLERYYRYRYPYYSYYRPHWGRVYPHIYCYYGSLPPYIIAEYVFYVSNYSSYFNDYNDDYYLSRYSGPSYRTALSDIRDAWLTGDIRKIDRYLWEEDRIAIYLDGNYKYSMDAMDFYTVTRDAMSEVRTEQFDYVKIDRRGSSQVRVIAKHILRDSDGQRHSVYASYLLKRIEGEWWIVAAGSAQREVGF